MKTFSATWSDAMDRCSGCGLCLPVCPVYAETGQEADSPRGQLALARGLARWQIQPEAAGEYLGHCLLCGRCAQICPARLPLQEIFFAVRSALLLPLPFLWLRFSQLAAMRPKMADFLQTPLALSRMLFPGRKRPHMPHPAPLPYAPAAVANPSEGATTGGANVLFFPGCIARRFQPQLARHCAEALNQCGFNVVSLAALPCCGRPLGVQGQGIIALARRWLQILADHSFAYFVTPCPGCMDTFTRVWPSIQGFTDKERDQMAAFAGRWRNVLELTADLKGWHGDARIFWHRPCLESDASETASFSLLRDYEICSSGDGGCCGAALRCLPDAGGKRDGERKTAAQTSLERWRRERQTPLREALPRRILRQARAHGASIIATTCPGCKLVLGHTQTMGGPPIAVRHPLEILLERPQTGRRTD